MDIFSTISKDQDEDSISAYLNLISSNMSTFQNAVPLRRNAVFPNKPGVYCIFDNELLIYAGETGSLKERMKDIFRTMNHSFRRSLGKHKYPTIPGVLEIDSKNNFPIDIEVALTEYMEKNLHVKVMPAFIGRKEIEERIIKTHEPLFNSRGQRGQKP